MRAGGSFDDIVLTSEEYIREVSAIEPRWLAELAPHFYEFRKPTSGGARMAICIPKCAAPWDLCISECGACRRRRRRTRGGGAARGREAAGDL